ncbi:YigZ family protein [Adlercreutzia murintestinalis]|uniref:YigZ family protein n=1 Tax=Adlercreutzia murintestinalis TaxID=2941325 RepID=UPI002041110D|nr:YigZ family protein [Adlercreutzia murintestinalis]
MDGYKTVAACVQAEVVEKKSRFIAQLSPADTEEKALAFLEAVRTEHAQARHNVYAYIVRGVGGAAERVRYSDDGEPSGTSGMPTLQTLQHAGLTDIICVTTRYFGGTLLGTGGLVRAYSAAAQAAIEAAQVVTVSACVDITLHVPYAAYEQIVRAAEDAGASVRSSDFAEEVTLALRMLAGSEGPLVEKLRELTRGQAAIEVSEPFEAVFS